MAPIFANILSFFGGDGMILIVLALLLFYGQQSSLRRPFARQGNQRIQEGLEGFGG